jgi:hypothetical protein
LLKIRDVPEDKDKLLWKWIKGAATTKADFGNPLATSDYSLCMYNGAGTLISAATAPAGGLCGIGTSLRACWRETARGFRYKDKALTPSGIQKVILTSGLSGKAKILVKGKGSLLDLPTLPVTSLPVRVQLNNSDGICWEAVYSTPSLNQFGVFKAKSD